MVTRLYTHPVFLEHITPPGHPERPDRLRAIERALQEQEFERLDRVEAPEGDEDTILYAHPEHYLKDLRAKIPDTGIVRVDEDTTASPKSFIAALTAVGASNAAVDDVFLGRADNVFAAIRPPGHHAEKATAMGFCLFNNAAIAARHAQKRHGAERVAIVDWDVHHGNGTQDIFQHDARVSYYSTHQAGLFPNSGLRRDRGAGNLMNILLPPGSGGFRFRNVWADEMLPAIDDFRPQLLLISAGFDAHLRDPQADLMLETDDFAWITGELHALARRHAAGRVVSMLEGGYDLQALAECSVAHVQTLLTPSVGTSAG